MRPIHDFVPGQTPSVLGDPSAPILLDAFTFGAPAMLARGLWAEVYRVAYERTMEVLRPTWYDRAMRSPEN